MKRKNLIKQFKHLYPGLRWVVKLFKNRIREGDPNDRILTLYIENTSDKKEKLTLFGAIKDPFNLENSKKIKIKVIESSYESLRADLISSLFFTKIIQIDVLNSEQFSNPIDICYISVTGMEQRKRIWPDSNMYRTSKVEKSEEFNISAGINEKGFLYREPTVLDKGTYWNWDINPHEKIHIRIDMLARIGIVKAALYLQETALPYEEYNFKYFKI
jgi:hypothetical protein